jgi:aspartate-semialdehyde dehydrogenase
MSEGWNIAVLGATGAVGEALLETLAERQFPVGDIYALARNESAGEHLRFSGKSVIVQDAAVFDWTQVQLAFLPPALKRRRRMLKRRPTPVVWLSISAVCLRWSRTYRWWCRT